MHVAYGNALIAARGYGAPETTEALRAEPASRVSATGMRQNDLAADYGLWVGSYMRGEMPSMRAHAAAFLGDVEARPDSLEAGVAHRAAGCTLAGSPASIARRGIIWNVRSPCSSPAVTTIWRFASDMDTGVAAHVLLWRSASWPLGEVDRAVFAQSIACGRG